MRSYENADGQKQTNLNIVQRMFLGANSDSQYQGNI